MRRQRISSVTVLQCGGEHRTRETTMKSNGRTKGTSNEETIQYYRNNVYSHIIPLEMTNDNDLTKLHNRKI